MMRAFLFESTSSEDVEAAFIAEYHNARGVLLARQSWPVRMSIRASIAPLGRITTTSCPAMSPLS